MKVTFVASATTIVEYKNTKVLTDPWIIGKPFFGSWAHYPPVEWDSEKLRDIKYIYISHIHADHADEETLRMFNNDIPVIIYDFYSKGLENRLKSYGKTVITLKHGQEFDCGDGLKLSIYIADDCNPEVCFKHFGCGKMEKKYRASTIDTIGVFYNEKHTLVNVNDCPFELSQHAVRRIMKNHSKIDFLLTGYCGASAYPQCFENYSDSDKIYRGKYYKKMMLENGERFINLMKPRVYMPFAGTFTLAGKLSKLEKYKAVHTIEYALEYFSKTQEGKGILLNSYESYDIEKEIQSSPYVPTDYKARDKYIDNVLSKVKYSYENHSEVSLSEIIKLLQKSYSRFENKRKELQFSSDTVVYIFLPEQRVLELTVNGKGYKIIKKEEMNNTKYVSYRVDPKILRLILKGPRYAHWNFCEGGNHITFNRKPDIYQRGLSYCMNYFHS